MLPPHPPALLDEAEDVSREWLTLPKRREFGFAQGRFERTYIADTPLYVVRDRTGRLVAFVNEVRSYRPGEATFDMSRHRPGVHWGAMDYLLMGLMLATKERGFRTFNLGLAVFAGVGKHPSASLEEKAVGQLFEYLNWFVSAKGLRQYKAKFEPAWEDRYVAYEGGPIGIVKLAIAVTRAL